MKRLLSVVMALTFLGDGIAHAAEPARASVTVVRDRAALAAYLDALEVGDRIAVATDDGIVAGEFVDKDADDLVVDQPLIEGGAERITVPLKEVQGVRFQATAASPGVEKVEKAVIVAVLVGLGVWLLRAVMLPRP